MKVKQKALVCSALLMLAGTALSACGKEENKPNASPSATAERHRSQMNTALSKPLELSVAVWDIQTGFDAPKAKNDTVYNDLTKKFNITIKPVQITWNDWQEKAKVWAASKQLPDMFANEVDLGLYQTWAKQGVIKPLPDDLSPYPNLKKLFSSPAVEPALRPLKVDGKYYRFRVLAVRISAMAGWAGPSVIGRIGRRKPDLPRTRQALTNSWP